MLISSYEDLYTSEKIPAGEIRYCLYVYVEERAEDLSHAQSRDALTIKTMLEFLFDCSTEEGLIIS
jgi:hypothetical protein